MQNTEHKELIQTTTYMQAVFSVENGKPEGVIWKAGEQQPVSFSGLGKLVLLIDEMSAEPPAENRLYPLPRRKGSYTCIVRVLFRQHSSLQGELMTVHGKEVQKTHFKSALELLRLLDELTAPACAQTAYMSGSGQTLESE